MVPRRFGGDASSVRCDNLPINEGNEEIVNAVNVGGHAIASTFQHAINVPDPGENDASHIQSSVNVLDNNNDENIEDPDLKCRAEELATILVSLIPKVGEGNVQSVISALNQSDFELAVFQEKFKKTKTCIEFVEKRVQEEMIGKGFEREAIQSEGGQVSCVMYKRCPIETLRDQMKSSTRNMYLSPFTHLDENGKPFFAHPMSAGIGSKAVPAVTSLIKRSKDPGVYWRSAESSGGKSFVGLGQLYSDKTQTSLKSSGKSLYPLHLKLFNFQEEERRDFISSGSSVVAFLPVEYINKDDKSGNKTYQVSRKEKMELLQSVIARVLEPLKDVAVQGFNCENRNNSLHCHFVIANYCCDIPEARDILGIKVGPRSTFGCHRCYVPSVEMSNNTSSKQRNVDDTIKCRERAKTLLEHQSVAKSRAVLMSTPSQLTDRSWNHSPL